MNFKPHKPLLIWAIGLTVVLLWLGRLAWSGLIIDTSLLSLLPQTEQDPVLAKVVDRFTARIGAKTLMLVGHADEAEALAGAVALAGSLQKSPLFEGVTAEVTETGKAAYELYFPFRYQMLSEERRATLQSPDPGGAQLVRQASEALFGPGSSAYSAILDRDPLLLFPNYLLGLPKPPGTLNVKHGFLCAESEGKFYFFVAADTTQETFSRTGQQQTEAFLLKQFADLKSAHPGLSVHSTGMIRYAAAGSAMAEQEISTIGLGSVLGVIALFLFVFRSWRPLALGLLPLLVGVICALASCFTVFGRLHLITFGFGASLIGVCIDYTFHFYCELASSDKHEPHKVLPKILPAISLGAFTSILGYVGLFIAPFPGLRQMALFSSVGLVGAFATVVLVFPYASGRSFRLAPSVVGFAQRYLDLWNRLKFKHFLILAPLPCLALVLGLMRLQSDDDIRKLQVPSPPLKLEEEFIRAIAGGFDLSRFLLVEGRTIEEVLERQEALEPSLRSLRDAGALSYFQGISAMLPSKARQLEDHRLLKEALLGKDQVFARYLEDMGFEEPIAQSAQKNLETQPEHFLELDTWVASQASGPLRHLWLGETDRGYAAMIGLSGIKDPDALIQLAASQNGVMYLDKVAEISSLLQRYRVGGSELVALSYGFIFLILAWRYGWRRGILVALPPLLASSVALAVFGWMGETINLFHVLALLMVLGIGIDYAIFFAEMGSQHASTMVAVLLSTLTTILSFGLLALSTTPVLKSFGIMVWVGIALSWFLAPLAAFPLKKR